MDLRGSVATSKLGKAKSVTLKGPRKSRTWPSCVPARSGRVLKVDGSCIVAELGGDGKPARKQSFDLSKGKCAYVGVGDRFEGNVSIIAGTPAKLSDTPKFLARQYDPIEELLHEDPVDRFAAVKALPFREEIRAQAVRSLEALLRTEREPRVALEAAGSAARLGLALGEDRILQVIAEPAEPYLPMEAVVHTPPS